MEQEEKHKEWEDMTIAMRVRKRAGGREGERRMRRGEGEKGGREGEWERMEGEGEGEGESKQQEAMMSRVTTRGRSEKNREG